MIKAKVTPDDGDPYIVKACSRDVATWERTNKGASLHQLQSEVRMTDVYKIVHIALTRQQLFTGTLKEFQDTVDLTILDADDEDDAEVPTPSAA
jgi:hypothetical protein